MKKVIITLALLAATISISAQEKKESKFSVDAGAGLVSSYIWRGMYQTGVSIQPALSLSAYGVTLGAWGSTDVSALAKELDFYVSYEIGRFSATLTDYWWMGEGASFFKERERHLFEASLEYIFSEKFPLSLGVNTMFFGDIDKEFDEDENKKGKQLYSTYITASYPFAVKDVECELGIGVSPWKGLYSDEFHIAAITAKATKELKITENFALPVFVELILAPAQDNAYMVFGLTFQ